VHPIAEAAGYEKMTTIIDIDLTDGRTISGNADFGKGSPTNPMSDEELALKFRECAEWGGLAKQNAEKIVDLVFSLEDVKSVRELTRLLAVGEDSTVQPKTKFKVRPRSRSKPKAKSQKLKAKSRLKSKSSSTALTQRSQATRRKR
jgi:hypothetical protein